MRESRRKGIFGSGQRKGSVTIGEEGGMTIEREDMTYTQAHPAHEMVMA